MDDKHLIYSYSLIPYKHKGMSNIKEQISNIKILVNNLKEVLNKTRDENILLKQLQQSNLVSERANLMKKMNLRKNKLRRLSRG